MYSRLSRGLCALWLPEDAREASEASRYRKPEGARSKVTLSVTVRKTNRVDS